ncbi:DUF397 domain-containing protein [Streptomyces fuscichromogenes]|uniref:DUF397 domain-containing protein n=1 Tax=Streptomyces fuscichromogenes TaxID=1324013 RepID=UPI0038026376
MGPLRAPFEVADGSPAGAVVPVRDSKNPSGPVLTLAATATGVTSWSGANAVTIGRGLYNGSNTALYQQLTPPPSPTAATPRP